MSTERPYHFDHLLQVLKHHFEVGFYTYFFNVFKHIYSPSPGAENPLVTKFWRQQKAQITLTICCKFQNDLFEFWFYTQFLIILYMYIAPGQGQIKPWGQNFDVNRKLLPLRPFVASFKNISLNSNLYTFLMFFQMYRDRGRQPFVNKILMSTERPCHFAHLLQVSKKYLWSLNLYIFLPVFIHVYSPGTGADNPLGSEFLI